MLGLIFLPHYYLPFLQDKGQVLQTEVLQGAYEQTHRPNFWPKKWMNGAYQKGFESYVRDRNPITPFAVRLNTQIDYSLYNSIAHQNIFPGKDGDLYTKTDCEAYVGLDFIGRKKIETQVQKLRDLIDHYQADSIPFLVLVPAGKPGILPHKMPAFYQDYPIDSTNRQVFLSVLKKYNIPHLDFDFLKTIRDTSEESLFGQASLHWSRFAYSTTADTLRSYIIRNFGIDLPQMKRASLSDQETAFSTTDKELVNGANFLQEPDLKPIPYPEITFSSDSTLQKQRILSIGDSYYLSFYKNGIHEGLFYPKSKFLYYNHEVYPESTNNGQRVYAGDLDILSEIERSKLVIITVYETNLKRFGFNFVEQVWDKVIDEG